MAERMESLAARTREAHGSPRSSAHDFTLDGIDGRTLPLKSFSGKPIVIVNTASKCGFTPQYAELQKLWQTYRNRGLVVLGVPSNDFGRQEPGDAAAISAFCKVTFGVDFPLAAKVRVRGAAADPLFQWIVAKGGYFSRPRWNFYKYLIGRDGQLADWFSSFTRPLSPKFLRSVEGLLG